MTTALSVPFPLAGVRIAPDSTRWRDWHSMPPSLPLLFASIQSRFGGDDEPLDEETILALIERARAAKIFSAAARWDRGGRSSSRMVLR